MSIRGGRIGREDPGIGLSRGLTWEAVRDIQHDPVEAEIGEAERSEKGEGRERGKEGNMRLEMLQLKVKQAATIFTGMSSDDDVDDDEQEHKRFRS